MIKGSKHSPEALEKMAAARRGKRASEETRIKMSETRRGVPTGPRSEETKQRISETLSGRTRGPHSKEHSAAISRALRGKRSDGTPMQGHYLTSEGYRKLTSQQGHPMAYRDGTVLEHVKVLYDKIGPGEHRCHWGCGRMLSWRGEIELVVDHLDNDILNNDPDNLVPSCRGENWARGRRQP